MMSWRACSAGLLVAMLALGPLVVPFLPAQEGVSGRDGIPVMADGKAVFDGFTNTVITSGWMKFDYRRRVATFTTNVVVTDQRIIIKSNEMTVLFDDTNSVDSVTAVGDVRFWQADKEGSARQAVYMVDPGEIHMLGDATLTRGAESITGKKKIVFRINDRKVMCEPAEIILLPGGEMKNSNIFDW